MISRCLLVLISVIQISAFKYNSDQCTFSKCTQSSSNNVLNSYSSHTGKQNSGRSLEPKSGNAVQMPSLQMRTSLYKGSSFCEPPIIRHLVAKSKYSVALQNSDHFSEKKIPVINSHVKIPLQEKPIVRLPAKIPAPRTIAHTCTCYKTIVKPRVQETIITIPTIQRYLETTHRPVLEHFHYEVYPTEPTSPVQNFQCSAFEVVKIPKVQEMNLVQISNAQIIPNPRFHTLQRLGVQLVNTQPLVTPHLQLAEAQEIQNVGTPDIELADTQSVQATDSSYNHLAEAQRAQAMEASYHHLAKPKQTQVVEASYRQLANARQTQAIEARHLRAEEAQKAQALSAHQLQSDEAQRAQTIETHIYNW